MLKRIAVFVLALIVLGCGYVGIVYSRWHSAQVARLEAGSRVAKTAKGAIEYALSGKGPRTILFVHGTPGGYDQGKRLELSAHARGYRVLTVSRPGYLRTPLSTGETPAAQADAYAALLDTLHIDRVNIMGASGGGPSAAELAARHPERCESLVMLSAVSKSVSEPPRPVGFFEAVFRGTDFGAWLAWRQLHRDPTGVLAQRGGERYGQIAKDPARVQSYLSLADSALVLVSRRTDGIVNDRKTFANMPEIPLASIRCPAMAVHARNDTTVPLDHAEHVAKTVPGAELVVIEKADHLVSISHPEETFGPVYAMLDRIGRPQPAAAPAAEPVAAH